MEFFKKLFNGIFYWLTNCLMPSDKCNSITAKAMGLIFSLFDDALSLDVPFGTPQYYGSMYNKYILYGLTRALLCVPFIFAHHERCWFCGRHTMASMNFHRPGFRNSKRKFTPQQCWTCRKPPTSPVLVSKPKQFLEVLIVYQCRMT